MYCTVPPLTPPFHVAAPRPLLSPPTPTSWQCIERDAPVASHTNAASDDVLAGVRAQLDGRSACVGMGSHVLNLVRAETAPALERAAPPTLLRQHTGSSPSPSTLPGKLQPVSRFVAVCHIHAHNAAGLTQQAVVKHLMCPRASCMFGTACPWMRSHLLQC